MNAAEVFDRRRAFWKHGYRPIAVWNPDQLVNDKGEPLKNPGKQPRGTWRIDAGRDPPDAVRIEPDTRALNTGILCQEVVGFDIDVLDSDLVEQLVARIERTLGASPLNRIGRAPKILLVYRPDQPFAKVQTPELFFPDGTKAKVELLADGQQFVADGIHPDTSEPYRWTEGTPADVPLEELPIITEEQAHSIIAEAELVLRLAGATEKEKPQPERRKANGHAGDFFAQVNTAALNDIAAWARSIFPRARFEPGTSAWRVSSVDLGRDLEEDISIHPDGVRDFGEELPSSAINLVIQYGSASNPLDGALWLCERLRIDPASLGYRAKAHKPTEAAQQAQQSSSEPPNGAAKPCDQNEGLRFKFTPFRDIELDTSPPYRVHELLPRVGVAVIWGRPKSGKTFWTFDLEMHVALGWDYRGRAVEQGLVLHIACEGARGLGARKEAWRLHHIVGKTPAEIAAIEAAPFHLCKDTALDLIKDAPRVIADIDRQFGGQIIGTITIDTLNRSLRGSESKDEDMGAYLAAAIALAERFQCLVLIIHHCGHNEDRPRGHSSLLGSADALIETKKDEQNRIVAEVEEMRDGPNGAVTYSMLKVVTAGYDDNLNPITSCVVIPDESTHAEASQKPGTKPPSPMGRKFHDALLDALCTAIAERRPNCGKGTSVTQDTWIQELDRLGLLDKDGAPNKRRALVSKYRAELIAANYVACNGDFIWSTQKENRHGDKEV
jgi:hypothetical protein